jgi:hypothetical protein
MQLRQTRQAATQYSRVAARRSASLHDVPTGTPKEFRCHTLCHMRGPPCAVPAQRR